MTNSGPGQFATVRRIIPLAAVLLLTLPAPSIADSSPPLQNTVWLYNNIITSSDPSAFRSVTYAGQGDREFYDRSSGMWITLNVYLFDVQYDSRQTEWQTEFQVHPEHGSREAAREQVDAYAPVLGRLPRVLLSNANEVEISRTARTMSDDTLDDGEPPAQANPHKGLLHIYTERAEEVARDGFLEEVFIHEAGHFSLDRDHAQSPGWRAAQQADGRFLTPYARDHPEGEDVAESIWGYFVVNYRPERISMAHREAILDAIPNRLAYFDEQRFDMSPYVRVTMPVPALPLFGLLLLGGVLVARGVHQVRLVT